MQKKRSPRLPKTSRLTGNALEYYMKFGKERDLERFMRFRSPGGSQKSSSTNSASNYEDWTQAGNLNQLFGDTLEENDHISSKNSSSSSKEHIIPIRIESNAEDNAQESSEENLKSTTGQNVPKTPPRLSSQSKETQTPESIRKAHKRLEWDSLGDVGYKKSKSTSNVSIVERMLLREFFEVSSNKVSNASESDIRQLEQEIAELGTLKKQFERSKAKDESKYSTPPLASSTHVEPKSSSSRVKTKVISVGTNTSTLLQKFEKYAQTSCHSPEMASQSVQVTLTSAENSPLLGSSAEPSSFEYQKKHSSHSSDSKSTMSKPKSKRPSAGETQHPYAEDIDKILKQQKPLVPPNYESQREPNVTDECQSLKSMYSTWQKMIGDDKENSSSSSNATGTSNASQVDFGVQLICEIMKAKSIEQKQKKKLVRSIVKRVAKIANSRELDALVSRTSKFLESPIEPQIKPKTQKTLKPILRSSSTSPVRKMKTVNLPQTDDKCKSSAIQSTELKVPEKNVEPLPKVDKQLLLKKEVLRRSKKKPQENVLKETVQKNIRSEAQLPKDVPKDLPKEYSDKRATLTNTTIDQKSSSSSTTVSETTTSTTTTTTSSSSSSSSNCEPVNIELQVCMTERGPQIEAVVVAEEKVSSTTSTTTSTSSSSSSKDLPTQEQIKSKQRKSSNETDEVDMQEWLNPMTQSEIEYENQKRASDQKLKKSHTKSSKTVNCDCGAQLDWIECEIKRLQKLRQRLCKDDVNQQTARPSTNSQASDKLYDTVYSDQSQGKSDASSRRKVVNGKSPRASKEQSATRKSTTQQRSKMSTPNDSYGEESVGSFVRRRKHEFLEHYKTQKMQHYDNMQKMYNERPSTSAGTTDVCHVLSDYMNLNAKHRGSKKNMPTKAYHTYPPAQQKNMESRHILPNYQNIQNAKIGSKITSKNVPSKSVNTQISSTTLTESSELSVPMGSFETSSTPTTTHQYDDVAKTAYVVNNNVGSQTGASLPRCRPIYETRCMSPCQVYNVMPYATYMATCGQAATTACIQVQPKGIAYSVQFEPKKSEEKIKTSSSKSSSSTTSTSSRSTSDSAELKLLEAAAGPSLQEALAQRRPEFIKHAMHRKSILNSMQKIRLERDRQVREIADQNVSVNTLDKNLKDLPPPATERLRIFPTKQMKAMTKKRVAKLPEVLAGKERAREEQTKRSNRLIREVFNKRLQKRVRTGSLTFKHSRTLI